MRGRIAIGAVVAALAMVIAIAWRVERVVGLGLPETRVAVHIDPDAVFELDPVTAIWRARLPDATVTVRPRPATADGRIVDVTVTGGRYTPDATAAALERVGAVGFYWVVSDSELATAWHRRFATRPATDRVIGYDDSWEGPDGAPHFDYFLTAPTPGPIRAALAADAPDLPVPPELALVFERVMPRDGRSEAEPYVRSYLVEREPVLGPGAIAAATVTADEYTARPLVMLEFTRAAAEIFGDATASHLGWKLAIMVDGEVTSAPVVQSAIRGGRVTITMGGSDLRSQEAAAQALAATLNAGTIDASLPQGLHAQITAAAGPTDDRWLARGLFALVCGAIAGFAAGRLAAARGTSVPPPPRSSPLQWLALVRAIAVTAGVLGAVWFVGDNAFLPGVTSTYFDVAGRGGDEALRRVSVFALGLGSFSSAVVLIELIACAVPAWRRRRLGSPADRRVIDLVVVATTLGLALIQAYFLWKFMASVQLAGAAMVEGGALTQLGFVVTAVAGVVALLVAARAITRWGLGHGVVALLGFELVRGWWLARPHSEGDAQWRPLAVALVIAAVTIALVRQRPGRGARLPWGGAAAAAIATNLMALLALISVAWQPLAEALTELAGRTRWADVALAAIVMAVVLWQRRARWHLGGAVASVGYVALLLLSPALLPDRVRVVGPAIFGALLGAIGYELVVGVGARLRLADPIAVAVLHDVDRIDLMCDRLTAEGIAHAAPGRGLRAAMRWLAAYAPISILVARVDVDRALAALADDASRAAAAIEP